MFIFTRSIVIIIIFIISGSQPGSSFWQSDTPTYLDSFEAEQFPVEHQYRPATIRTSPWPQVMITSKVQLTM